MKLPQKIYSEEVAHVEGEFSSLILAKVYIVLQCLRCGREKQVTKEDQLTPIPHMHYRYCVPSSIVTEGYLENRDL